MTNATTTTSGPAAKQIKVRQVDDLLLDPENPRLAEEGKELSQDELLAKLYANEALDELATSFARSGYFWEEPLVVVPAKEAGKLVAVEGNRRLATLKLLLSPKKRAELSVKDFPTLTAARESELKDVPTVEYTDRADVIPYLGFRHITGAKKWDPYPKARYIAKLIDAGQAFDTIETSIGDGAKTARKLYQAYAVFGQIRDDLDEDVQNVKESFSLLEVMLGQQAIKNHLGVPRRLPDAAVKSIVNDEHLDALRETVRWVFGSKKGNVRPVITDSRDISKYLGPVISKPESLAHLRETGDLLAAAERTGGERDYLIKQLGSARRAAERALAASPQFKGDTDALNESERLTNVAHAIAEVLRP